MGEINKRNNRNPDGRDCDSCLFTRFAADLEPCNQCTDGSHWSSCGRTNPRPKDSAPADPAVGGTKQVDGKLPLDLIPWGPVMEVAQVLQFGAQKYDSWNWSKGLSWMGCIAGALRHTFKWIGGQDNDDETGLSHIAHAITNLMFLLHFIRQGGGTDDRPSALVGSYENLPTPDPELWAKYAGFLKK